MQAAYCSWLSLFFSSPSFCPQYPRLVFPPTLPIILDVITHYNVTQKGKRLLCLETDLPLTNSCLWTLVKKVPRKSQWAAIRPTDSSDICILIICRQHSAVLKHPSLSIFARLRETGYFCTSDNNLSQTICCLLKAEKWSEPHQLHTKLKPKEVGNHQMAKATISASAVIRPKY